MKYNLELYKDYANHKAIITLLADEIVISEWEEDFFTFTEDSLECMKKNIHRLNMIEDIIGDDTVAYLN